MEGSDMRLLMKRPRVLGNVVARWMQRNAVAVGVSAALALALCASPASVAFEEAVAEAGGVSIVSTDSASESTAVFEKSEVVYASLSSSGAAESAYVVNRFDVEEAGDVVDFGEYDAVKNLTTTDSIAFDDGEAAIAMDAGTFFYQGNLSDVQLPWNVSVTYELDGEEVSADAAAGKSGHMSIKLDTSQNESVDPAFFDSFMLQVTFTFDSAKCTHIVADGATMADAGASQTVAFTVLPGRSGDMSVSFDATDFEMAGIQIAGLAYSSPVEVPDTSEMTDGMKQLADGVGSVASGSGQLAGSGSELASGASALASGISEAASGASQVEAAGAQIEQGAAAIGDGISQAADGLPQVGAILDGIDTNGMSQADAMKLEMAKNAIQSAGSGLSQLSDQYSQYESGVSQYVNGVSELGYGLEQLESGADELSSGVRKYVGGVEELNGGIQTLDGETSKLPQTMQEEIDGMLEEFDFPEFAPRSFVSAQNQNVRAVQFVMTTPDIVVAEDESQVIEPEAEETFLDRLFALFS